MDLRQLRYFLAVAEELHFGRAAERLHITQPPLTVAIRQLERELGAALFDRTTRRVTMTPAGVAFRQRVQAAVAELEEAAADVVNVAAGLSGKLQIGFVSSASYTVVPEAIREFRLRLPRVDLALNPLTSGEQVEQILDGHLDVGVIRDPGIIPGLALDLIQSEALLAVLPEGHPLATNQEISPNQLRDEPMILFPYQLMPGFVTRVTALFHDEGIAPKVAHRIVHQETVLGLVAAGLGISVLPESVRRFQMPGVITLPMAGRPTTDLYSAHTGTPSPAAAEFMDCLQTKDPASQQ